MKCKDCGCEMETAHWSWETCIRAVQKERDALKSQLAELQPKADRFAGLRSIRDCNVNLVGSVFDINGEIKDILQAYDEIGDILVELYNPFSVQKWLDKWWFSK